ncbi:MAG: hypothetical protein LBI36_05635 [Oscillospiraceae bacterium]|jgi:hypothetical protein|nr:hypothetical protein [Oscillospiraceae bacterium]
MRKEKGNPVDETPPEGKKHRSRIIDAVVGDFESDIDEIDEVFDVGESDGGEEGDSPPKARRVLVTIAVFMIFFSVIGVITSARFVSGVMNDIADRKALKNEFALFVYPVVINDPPAYDTVDNLPTTTIITCAIWKIILVGDTSNYERDLGSMRVPAVDVELSARSIFGTGSIRHENAGNFEVQFLYYEEENAYIVPENPLFLSYSPVISEITNVDELYTVTVEYMAPSPLAIAGIDYENRSIKTMIYTISRTKDKMSINSIKFAGTIGI